MSTISTAICRSFLLWWHLGIGPMIGAGPMQAQVRRPTRARARAAAPIIRKAAIIGASGTDERLARPSSSVRRIDAQSIDRSILIKM
jgi:hypothetical protein